MNHFFLEATEKMLYLRGGRCFEIKKDILRSQNESGAHIKKSFIFKKPPFITGHRKKKSRVNKKIRLLFVNAMHACDFFFFTLDITKKATHCPLIY